ncbi:MAG: HEAT repeat domain-containing protein [Planctomycetes bacterium]|nr:HEAT repeat domain-containing protein [Planctomycetota bacterium]
MSEEKPTRRWLIAAAILAVAAVSAGIWMVLQGGGEAREKALRKHIARVTGEDPPFDSVVALREAGPSASFRAWMALVRDTVDKPPREWTVHPMDALRALVRIHGDRSGEGGEVLLAGLSDGRREIRLWTLAAISRVCSKRDAPGSLSPRILPSVIEALGDPDAEVRDEACDCFVDIHPAWQVGLTDCLRHPNPLVRCTAIDSLGLRGGDEDRAGRFPDAVLPMLDDPDAKVRATAAVSLARLKRGGPRVVELLRETIRGDDPDLRSAACSAIGELGAAAAAAVPDLLARLSCEDDVTRRCAASSLADIAPATAATSEAACAILVKAVEGGDMPAVFAARSLGNLGRAAPPAVISALEQASTSNHAFVREEAKRALERIRAKGG